MNIGPRCNAAHLISYAAPPAVLCHAMLCYAMLSCVVGRCAGNFAASTLLRSTRATPARSCGGEFPLARQPARAWVLHNSVIVVKSP